MLDTSHSLLQRLQRAPDNEAWQQLVELYTPLIQHWLRRQHVPSSEADDLTQETLTAVVRDLPRFQHPGHKGAFRGWLRGIAVNRLRGYWRKIRNHPVAADMERALDQLEDPASDLSRQWDQEHDRHVAHRLLERIKPDFEAKTWQAFHRVVMEDADPETVAGELGVMVTVIWNAKSRVLRRLRQDAVGLLDGVEFL